MSLTALALHLPPPLLAGEGWGEELLTSWPARATPSRPALGPSMALALRATGVVQIGIPADLSPAKQGEEQARESGDPA